MKDEEFMKQKAEDLSFEELKAAVKIKAKEKRTLKTLKNLKQTDIIYLLL